MFTWSWGENWIVHTFNSIQFTSYVYIFFFFKWFKQSFYYCYFVKVLEITDVAPFLFYFIVVVSLVCVCIFYTQKNNELFGRKKTFHWHMCVSVSLCVSFFLEPLMHYFLKFSKKGKNKKRREETKQRINKNIIRGT